MLVLASDTEPIYKEFQTIWKKYMKSNPNIDCYFYKGDPNLETEFKLDNDTLWIKIDESFETIYEKTLRAFEYFSEKLNQYDFIFRTNLSSFIVMDKYVEYCHTLPKQQFVSAVVGNAGYFNFPSGCGFTISTDLVLKLVNDKPLKIVEDDVTIGNWLYMNGIPIQPVSRCDFTNNLGISHFQNKNNSIIFHYRVKNDNRLLDIEIHEKLLLLFYGLRK